MTEEWNQSRLQQYIDDEVQESLTLDYKAADSLGKTDKKKSEITKDVAAMANSAGGTIIYGIKEYDDLDKRHIPEKIDPVDLTQFSKEWLEQVIMNVRPRIQGVNIFPVPIDTVTNGTVYVVEIPQSTTAHQSNDHRYYKRYNFLLVPMEDYEIRDIMGRNIHPRIELRFEIEVTKHIEDVNALFLGERRRDPFGMSLSPDFATYYIYTLKTYAFNAGSVFAQYVNAHIELPYDFLQHRKLHSGSKDIEPSLWNPEKMITYLRDNTVRDAIRSSFGGISEKAVARYVPILPLTTQQWENSRVNQYFENIDWKDSRIKWVVYCDNAPPSRGDIAITDIPIIDRRNENEKNDE